MSNKKLLIVLQIATMASLLMVCLSMFAFAFLSFSQFGHPDPGDNTDMGGKLFLIASIISLVMTTIVLNFRNSARIIAISSVLYFILLFVTSYQGLILHNSDLPDFYSSGSDIQQWLSLQGFLLPRFYLNVILAGVFLALLTIITSQKAHSQKK